MLEESELVRRGSLRDAVQRPDGGRHCALGAVHSAHSGSGAMFSSPPSTHNALAPAIDWILKISTFPGEISIKKQESERGHDTP